MLFQIWEGGGRALGPYQSLVPPSQCPALPLAGFVKAAQGLLGASHFGLGPHRQQGSAHPKDSMSKYSWYEKLGCPVLGGAEMIALYMGQLHTKLNVSCSGSGRD